MSTTVDPTECETAAEESPAVSACETCPGRVVFTENDNPDGWIATDLTVTLTR